MFSILERTARDERGATIVLFVAALFAICGFMGVLLDFGQAHNARTKLQGAVDTAVLAAMQVAPELRQTEAEKVFGAEVYSMGLKATSLSFPATAANQFTVAAHFSQPTSFSRLLGWKSINVETTSTAEVASQSKVCIMALDPAASQALLVNGGADIHADACEMHVKSTGPTAGVLNAGTRLDTSKLCIEGTSILDNGGYHPTLQTGCHTAADPYENTFIEPDSSSCDYNHGNFNGGAVTMSPGVYCGWFNFNAGPDVQFEPGVYVIKGGGWNVNGGAWTGDGVTFFFADESKIQFNSGVDLEMTAPTSGDYKDVFMFEAADLTPSHFVVDDSLGFDFTGIMYLPSRDTIFNSNSDIRNKHFALVVKTLILNNTSWIIEPVGSSALGAISARLVR